MSYVGLLATTSSTNWRTSLRMCRRIRRGFLLEVRVQIFPDPSI